MTDKERIYTLLIKGLLRTSLFPSADHGFLQKSKSSEIRVGDLVVATTSGIHDFTIGYVVEIVDDGDMVVREVGGNRECHIRNEEFFKIPMDTISDKYQLLEGQQFIMYQKVIKALRKLNDRNNLFLGVEFDEKVCRIKTRKECTRDVNQDLTIKYNSKTTIKEIMRLISKGGGPT